MGFCRIVRSWELLSATIVGINVKYCFVDTPFLARIKKFYILFCVNSEDAVWFVPLDSDRHIKVRNILNEPNEFRRLKQLT